MAPSFSPSRSPSTSPSFMPTRNPTIPSSAPTQSPTACPDDNPQLVSNDGTNAIANKSSEISHILSMISDVSELYNVNDTDEHYGIDVEQLIQCDGNVKHCYFECYEPRSCSLGLISNKDISINSMVLKCIGSASCSRTPINITNTTIQYMNIMCEGYRSCESMEILIIDTVIESIRIQCIGDNSCNFMDLNINIPDVLTNIMIRCENYESCAYLNYKTNKSPLIHTTFLCNHNYSCNTVKWQMHNSSLSVYCIDPQSCHGLELESMANLELNCFNYGSCDYMEIKADGNATININMYEYSKNVSITHTNIDKINVKCGHGDDKMFIRYDIADLKTDDELLDFGRSQYQSSHLPCDGITINCTKDPYFQQGCDYQYDINHTQLNLTKFLRVESSPNIPTTCFWVDISSIFSAYCYGECGITLYEYNTTLDFDIAIDNTNVSKWEREIKCSEFFDSVNSTENTLSDIKAIFENVIDTVYDRYDIYQIIDGPNVYLRDGKMEVNCTNPSETHGINLSVIMTSLSRIDNNTNNFDLLWVENHNFTVNMQHLLSLYFGIDVNVFVKHIKEYVPGAQSASVVGYVIAVVTAMFIVIGAIAHYRRLKEKQRLDSMTTFIKNPLIILIAIGQYDRGLDNKYKEVDAHFVDLESIEEDIKNMVSLFKTTLNYFIIPEYDDLDSIKTHWTKSLNHMPAI